MPPKTNSKDVTIRGGVAYTPDNLPTDNKTTTPPPQPTSEKTAASVPPKEPTE